ncbi:hypothetical protein [Aureispira anguillae]|uniref:Outer membrane protein beta-barrel domain-containing protein n=1 Tax=Aureispira anguillae TaxID=2864201 RepID=A0A916DW90_9BACT|nr:hypothetical protein [Aureispira anguillae]BDS14410.1 hypothetical protein AsAng_0051900 [Aureispira anguillae]
MNVKKGLLLICCLMYSSVFFAQEKTRIHELGLSFNSGLDFGLIYKTGKANSLFRISTLFFNGTNSITHNSSHSFSNNSIGAGFSLGAEFRKNIASEFFFSYGFDAGLDYRGAKRLDPSQNQEVQHFISPTINLLLGVGYVLKKHLVFSLEVMPYFSYNISILEPSPSINHQIAYGFNINSVKFVVAYRF